MEHHSTLRRHAELFDNMANALGADIEEAVMTGRMQFDEVSELVLRCAGCKHPDCCEALLGQSARLAEAPDYCRNRRLMAALQRGVA